MQQIEELRQQFLGWGIITFPFIDFSSYVLDISSIRRLFMSIHLLFGSWAGKYSDKFSHSKIDNKE